jgi:hypothetical protein
VPRFDRHCNTSPFCKDHPMQGEFCKDEFNLVGKRRVGTYRSSSVLNQVPVVSLWKMDLTCDNIKLNPSAGTWDTVPRALGIWDWLNIPFIIPIQSWWLPKPFAAAKIHHEGSIQTFGASVKAPLGEDGWRWASVSGRYPPYRIEGGKRSRRTRWW